MRHGLHPSYRYAINQWRIIDGDTVVVSVSTDHDPTPKHHIHLAGIDTPELGQPFTAEATDAIAMAFNQTGAMDLLVTPTTDRYGRAVGILEDVHNGFIVNEWLVRNGLARATFTTEFANYTTAETLAQHE